MKDFLILLGWLSLAGSVLGLAVTAVGRWSKGRLSRAFCCGLWVLVLLRLALPVAAPQTLGGHAPFLALRRQLPAQLQTVTVPEQDFAGNAAAPEAVVPAVGSAAADSALPAPALPEKAPVQSAEDTPAQSTADENTVPAAAVGTAPGLPRVLSVTLTELLFAVWAAGAVLRFAWKLSSYHLYRRRLLRWATPAPQQIRAAFAGLYGGSRLRLVCSPEVHAALLLGIKDPVLVLPQQLPKSLQAPEATNAALQHELTHYRRGDLWLKWAAELVCCIHWFNPLLPLLRKEISRACELACDEAVISTMNAAQRQAYGEMLIALAGKQGRSAVPLTAICEYKHQLKERLVCIMTYKKKNLLSVIACCCLLALLCGCAAVLGPAEEVSDAPPAESTVTEDTAETTDEADPEPAPESEAATDPYAFDAEALRKEATVLTMGEATNEYVHTEVINLAMKGEMDFVNYRTYVLTGGRLWTSGYKKSAEENAPAPRRIVSYNTDGSDIQFLTLTAPALDESVFGTLPADHEWHQYIETLLDFGEAQPRVLREVIKYGPLDEGYLNPLGGFGYYVCSFDENGVLDEGTPLDFTPREGWFLNYLCSTPGKLWFKTEQSLGLGEAGSLLSFSMEDLSLLNTIPLPEGSSCLDAQGLADGRVVIQLVNPYPSGYGGAAYHTSSYRFAIVDPVAGTLSAPILLPEPFYIPFEPLATHSLSELPAEPTVVQSSMFTWDLETNTLHMTAEAASFGRNIELSVSNFIPRADGSVLVLEYDSSRLVIATPYPPEG